MSDSIDLVMVVVPARNEAPTLASHLESLARAEDRVCESIPRLDIVTVLALDSCTDDSSQIASTYTHVKVLEVEHGVVGEVRAAGVRHAVATATRQLTAPVERHATWLLCTDADSLVPEDWIETHLAQASSGADVVLGMVSLAPDGASPQVLRRWQRAHPARADHPHVHGANLGIRLDRYLEAGGFAQLSTGEDVDLVSRLRETPATIVSVAESPVTTSARRTGRAPAGFASFVLGLS